MNWCEINLARDLVYSTDKRRRVYRLLILYLVCCTVLLAFTARTASLRIIEGLKFQKQAILTQQKFNLTQLQNVSMPYYANQLQATLKSQKAEAASIRQALPDNLKTMLPLLVTLLKQSDGSELDKIDFSQQNEYSDPTLEFSISIPATLQSHPDILTRWKQDPVLQAQLDAITPVTTKQKQHGTSKIQIMSCKATFKESAWTAQDL